MKSSSKLWKNKGRSVSLFLRYKHLKKLNVWQENYVSGLFIRNVWREMNVELYGKCRSHNKNLKIFCQISSEDVCFEK